jgi:ABC-type sugar transport system ATPase subunit
MTPVTPLLSARSISKSFPGVQALREVDFDLYAGQVHGLVGENGAGKSTLMKVFAGIVQPDQGEVRLRDAPTSIPDPAHAQRLGIALVHQETNLFRDLSVAENIFASSQPTRGPLRVTDKRSASSGARALVGQLGFDLDPDSLVGALSLGQRQIVEIAKALALDSQILILDEPTAVLSPADTEKLFALLRRLKSRGLGIVYISHRLEELFTIADVVTVLRDGHRVGEVEVGSTSPRQLIRMMVGRDLEELYGASQGAIGEPVLEVENLTVPGRFEDVSFSVRAGEIVGLAGLIGAGRTEIALAIFGSPPAESGTVRVNGREVCARDARQAIRAGIAYVSEERRERSLFLEMSVRENLAVTSLRRLSRSWVIDRIAEHALADNLIGRLSIRTPTRNQIVRNLSGGNQQKVALGKWLAHEPRVLIVDEPTRGVDVGAKLEIYQILRALAGRGVAVVVISSELPEILGLADRVLVMHRGQLVGEMRGADATEQAILELASGHVEEEPPT